MQHSSILASKQGKEREKEEEVLKRESKKKN